VVAEHTVGLHFHPAGKQFPCFRVITEAALRFQKHAQLLLIANMGHRKSDGEMLGVDFPIRRFGLGGAGKEHTGGQ
jgi:hypothetical protein